MVRYLLRRLLLTVPVSIGVATLLDAPHLTVFPGLAIALLVLGFNFLGDGLRDATDPRRTESS